MRKYNLIGQDGNAYAIMGYVRKALLDEGFSKDSVREYLGEAMSGDYFNLISVSFDWLAQANGKFLEIDTEKDARRFLEWLKGVVGSGFHPDDDLREYEDEDGCRLFSEDEAAELQVALDACFDVCEDNGVDIYSLCNN